VAIPLGDGTRVVGKVSRHNRAYILLYVYFMEPADVCCEQLRPDGANLVVRTGSEVIEVGIWPIVGRDENFRTADWPMRFMTVRGSDSAGRIAVRFGDDVRTVVEQRRVSEAEAAAMPAEALAGWKYVRNIALKLLGRPMPPDDSDGMSRVYVDFPSREDARGGIGALKKAGYKRVSGPSVQKEDGGTAYEVEIALTPADMMKFEDVMDIHESLGSVVTPFHGNITGNELAT
jgi:hypothetical protein